MRSKAFVTVAGAVFAAVAAAHLLRVVFDWSVEVQGAEVPHWVSWVVALATGC